MSKVEQRAAYESLTKARLVELVGGFGLDIPSNRPKAEFVKALVGARRVSFADVLAELGRDELEQICRDHGLDDSGRKKQALVDRILGREAAEPDEAEASEPAPEKPARAKKAKRAGAKASSAEKAESGAAVQLELPKGRKLTVAELERYLWSAADILRGSIDSSDYKSFIFGMLFLKRLSDQFEEEAEALIAAGEAAEVAWGDPDEHQFFVPAASRWSKLQAAASDIGSALNKACVALEEANGDKLAGVMAAIDYNDPNRLGDTKNRDVVLGRLIQHFSKLPLRNADLSEPDMLGRAYEYLIEKFADDAGKKGGEFYTPHKVVEAIVEVLEPAAGMRICDPTCGSGGMLIQCAKQVERKGGSARDVSLFGQEKNLGTWGICKMNMLLHGMVDARIEKGDTIRDPKLVEHGALMLFDRVIANPPFSLDEWGREVAEADRYKRFGYGVPPKTKGDFAFVQHMVATLNAKGRLGVVMPHGVLFRGAAEGAIREAMLRADLFEAVIGLPPNLFYGTGIPAAILVLSRAKAKERKGKVLFVDASREFREGSNQNYLRDEDVAKIGRAFRAFADVEKYARVVEVAEIEKNDWNLNISRYVDTAEKQEAVDVGAAVARLRELERERAEAEGRMNAFLEELGF